MSSQTSFHLGNTVLYLTQNPNKRQSHNIWFDFIFDRVSLRPYSAHIKKLSMTNRLPLVYSFYIKATDDLKQEQVCFWQSRVLPIEEEKKTRTRKLKGKLFLFKVTKTRGRLENPSAFLASFANGHGSPWTPFDRLGHLDQCQRVLGKADTLLSRGEKGHFWLLFRHLISRRNTSICCQVHFSNWWELISTL